MKTTAISALLFASLTASVFSQGERRRRPGGARGPDNAPALGAAIPEVSAKTTDGKKTVELAEPRRHTVLIFGSHTDGPFTRQAVSLEKTYQEFKDRADFYLIYLKEAHASDGERPSREIKIEQHKTYAERIDAASGCVADLKLTMPLLVDDMKNTVGDAFHGHPDRLFVLSPDGKIAYRGERGPRGFDVREMREALERVLRKGSKPDRRR